MTPEAVFNIWIEKARRKQPATAAKFSEPSNQAEFIARFEVVELSKFDQCDVIGAFLKHLNLERALAYAVAQREARRVRHDSPADAGVHFVSQVLEGTSSGIVTTTTRQASVIAPGGVQLRARAWCARPVDCVKRSVAASIDA